MVGLDPRVREFNWGGGLSVEQSLKYVLGNIAMEAQCKLEFCSENSHVAAEPDEPATLYWWACKSSLVDSQVYIAVPYLDYFESLYGHYAIDRFTKTFFGDFFYAPMFKLVLRTIEIIPFFQNRSSSSGSDLPGTS